MKERMEAKATAQAINVCQYRSVHGYWLSRVINSAVKICRASAIGSIRSWHDVTKVVTKLLPFGLISCVYNLLYMMWQG